MREIMNLAGRPLLREMAMPKRDAEVFLLGIQRPLNEHLLKVLAFDFSPDLASHFRAEIRKWLRDIGEIRLKPQIRPGKEDWYFRLLFANVYGDGLAVQNVATRCADIQEDYGSKARRNAVTDQQVAEKLEAFHRELARLASHGEDVTGLAA